MLLNYLTPLIPQDREKYFVMDLEYLVLKEILGNFPEMFKVKLCFVHLNKGMRKNCMSKVGKKVGGRR